VSALLAATGPLAAALAASPFPSPSPTVLRAPPAGALPTVGAIVAILFAVAAGVLGYRVIRGGRGL
jgi:hypothetical protein